ncbi:uncharacterized protein GGS25DRAFT_517783 [Hypoxylon fragiforme]|uniref:uncharacterized protein n=1 Tax=Hypoxylon fragiforme TaxID=63214 RepID=UPI0020C73CEE|nr:uncharacterized protein GGS25DRAFT_517783 [Hypoxylon fragiforme]KAI2612086.1 hypothetical protein GGS25DRAFT_517783 [Hypoxylon fragiforme]
MAGLTTRFDYRHNCELLVGKYDFISVIITLDDEGCFKACAVRSFEDSREGLLYSEPCRGAMDAIQSLFNKSCTAVNEYITTNNGFSYPPEPKLFKDLLTDDDDTLSTVSGDSVSTTVTLSYWGSEDDEAARKPTSSAEPVNGQGNNIGKRRSKPSYKPSYKPSKPVTGLGSWSPRVGSPESIVSDDDQRRPPSRTRFANSTFTLSSPAATAYPTGWTTPPRPPQTPVVRLPLSKPQSHQLGPQYHAHPPPPPPPPIPAQPFSAHHAPTVAGMGSSSPTSSESTGMKPNNATTIPTTSLHYKASAPNLGSAASSHNHNQHNHQHHQLHRHAASLAPMTSPQHQPQNQHQHISPGNGHNQNAYRLYDVRLNIRWLGHGEQRVLEKTRASKGALQELAIAYVRAHASGFGKNSSTNSSSSQQQQQGHGNSNNNNNNSGNSNNNTGEPGWMLCARVRSACFEPGEEYDMSTYRGDDLTKLFSALGGSSASFPRFEIDVEDFLASSPPRVVQGHQQQQH